jgi:hypothetical protein
MEFKARGVNDAGLSVGWGFNPDLASPPPARMTVATTPALALLVSKTSHDNDVPLLQEIM